MANVFTILCIMQIANGVLLISFGIVDRTCIQQYYSFLMLPIWIGILVGVAGLCGIIYGREHRIRGYANLSMISSLKALSTMCAGLSLLAFYIYGSALAAIGQEDAKNSDGNKNTDNSSVTKNKDVIQGVFAMIAILSLAEMLIGLWVAQLDESQMIFGSTAQGDTRPLLAHDNSSQGFIQQPAMQQPVFHDGNQRFYQQPAVQVVPQFQHQPPQQPVYIMAQGGNAPGNQVYLPSNQPQQPQYVLVNTQQAPRPATRPTNQNINPGNHTPLPPPEDEAEGQQGGASVAAAESQQA